MVFTTPAPIAPDPLRSWRAVAVFALALAVGAWVFAFLLRRYLGLGTTYDLFINVQLATSWLQGKFLHDSLFINYLSVHAYFLSPLLAIVAYPFGAPGLLFAAGVTVAAGFVAMVKILRLFGVGTGAATIFATVATLMPLSLQVYQVDFYGFQIELLIPALALWLAYFLFRRRWLGSLLCGLALQALKEDCVLILVPVALVVLVEDCLRSAAAGTLRDWRRTWNLPALTVGLASVLITPVILYIVQSQPVLDPANTNGFDKVRTIDASKVAGTGSLITYLLRNLTTWLQSTTVMQWLQAVVFGTFGLLLLRPHLLAVGALTTVTAWLVQRDLMWAPRFAPTLAFIQLVACLGFVSAWRWWPGWKAGGVSRRRLGILATIVVLVAGGMILGQYRMAPACTEVYLMDPALALSPADRGRADALFEQYRRFSLREEPVVATEYLYRYIHDRNFLWYHRLRGRPSPEWILWDKVDVPLAKLWPILRANGHGDADHYRLFAQDGRFVVFRRKSSEERDRDRQANARSLSGSLEGPARLKVRIADGRAGLAEPILSVGDSGSGNLFFLRYLADDQLLLGVEVVGEGVYLSETISFEAGQIYDIELFCGSMLPPRTDDESPALVARRWEHGNRVHARFAGREVLNLLAPQTPLGSGKMIAGRNIIGATSAGEWFTGAIEDLTAETGFGGANGAGPSGPSDSVHLVLQLPGTPAGVPEPLVVIGEPGSAALGYIRVLPENRIRIGMEVWGWGAYESEPVEVEDPRRVVVSFALPGLLPPPDDPIWGTLPDSAAAAKTRHRYRASVDGAVVLEPKVAAPAPLSRVVIYGRNPVGGSWVGASFTGSILQIKRGDDGGEATVPDRD